MAVGYYPRFICSRDVYDVNSFLMEYDRRYITDYDNSWGRWGMKMPYDVRLVDGYYKCELNIAGTQRNTIKSSLTGNLLLVNYRNKTTNAEVSFKFPKEADLDTVTVKYIDGMLIVSAKPIVKPTREIPLS